MIGRSDDQVNEEQHPATDSVFSRSPDHRIIRLREVVLMTFLKTRFKLGKELTTKDLEHLAGLSTVYGIRGLSFEGQDLIVEYDASRVHEAEVLAKVRCTGVPVEPQQAIPAGAFDYTGEFRDFAWPTEGLTPVNQKVK
jgi:hypothetical protein